MSLAGRFFPPRCGWTAQLRLAIAGPRRGVLSQGAGRQVPVQRQAGGRRSERWTGRRGGGPAGGGGKRGAGELSTSFTPPPRPTCGDTAPGRTNRRPGPWWAGPAQAEAFIGHLKRCAGGACSGRGR